MPKLQCLCKYVIDVSRKDEIVECPVCGRRYRKPTYAEKHPKRGAARRHTDTAAESLKK